MNMTKAELARHIGQPHGGCSNITPINERLRWSREELEASHRWLLEKGPCNTGHSVAMSVPMYGGGVGHFAEHPAAGE